MAGALPNSPLTALGVPTLTGDVTSESALVPDGGALVVTTNGESFALQLEVVR